MNRSFRSARENKEDDLALFLEMRSRDRDRSTLFLHDDSDLAPPPGSKPGTSPLFKIVSSAPRTLVDDFLDDDADKNDYDWLLTPPGTPLFPHLEKDSNSSSPVTGMLTARPTLLKSRLANPSDSSSRSSLASRQAASSSSLNSYGVGSHRPSSSGGISTASRPSTPTGPPKAFATSRPSRASTPTSRATLPGKPSRSSILTSQATLTGKPSRSSTLTSQATLPGKPSRASTPTSRSTLPGKPSRASTPTSRSTLPGKPVDPPPRSLTPARSSTLTSTRSSEPTFTRSVVPASTTFSTPASARSPTPTSRPSLTASKTISRSATPTRRASTPSSIPSSAAPPGRSSSVTKSGSTVSQSSIPSRGSSPIVRSRPWKPSDMPGFTHDAPPNLRTSMPDRPSSACRGRPGAPSSRSSSVEPPQSIRPRRQSCSPSRGRAPNVTVYSGSSVPAVSRLRVNGGDSVSPVLIGSKMVQREVNARRLVPPKSDDQRSSNYSVTAKSSPESTGFGRNLSRKSLDMAMRHMDIRRSIPNNLRPLMTNIPASSIYSVRSGHTRSRPVSVSDSPIATSSNASSEQSLSNNIMCLDGSEVEDDLCSDRIYRSSPVGPHPR